MGKWLTLLAIIPDSRMRHTGPSTTPYSLRTEISRGGSKAERLPAHDTNVDWLKFETEADGRKIISYFIQRVRGRRLIFSSFFSQHGICENKLKIFLFE